MTEHEADDRHTLASLSRAAENFLAVGREYRAHARFDLEVRGGCRGATRLPMAGEDQGSGARSVRLRTWPRFGERFGERGVALALVLVGLGALAARDGAVVAAALLGASGAGLLLRAGLECMAATGAVLRAAAPEGGPTVERQRPLHPTRLRRRAVQGRPFAPQLVGLFLHSLLGTTARRPAPMPASWAMRVAAR